MGIKLFNNQKIVTVIKYSDVKRMDEMKLYSIGVTALIDPTFTTFAIGIFAVACLENYLGTKGNVFLAELINSIFKITLGIGGIIAAYHFLTANAIVGWLL